MSDWLQNYLAEKKKRIIETGQSHEEIEPVCPYCGEDFMDCEMYPRNQEEWEEVECHNCESHFMIEWVSRFNSRKCQ